MCVASPIDAAQFALCARLKLSVQAMVDALLAKSSELWWMPLPIAIDAACAPGHWRGHYQALLFQSAAS